MKIIAISGVPGTGKTTVAKKLAKKMNANLIEIKKLIGKGIPYQLDKKRKTKIVEISDVKKAVKKHLKPGINIIDGHYSHMLGADFTAVLRTRPDILEKRMKKRKWPKRKIKENIQCEILDEISQETKKGIEIDTTKTSPDKIIKILIDILKKPSLHKKYRIGKINWSEKYKNYLIESG